MQDRINLTRRSFVAGAASASAALGAGGALAGAAFADEATDSAAADAEAAAEYPAESIYAVAATPAEASETKDCDIVVIGSGIAGMSCAVEASLAGAKVIVVEKRGITGGDSSICTGNFYCCGSKKQDDMGLTAYGTPEELAQFYFDQSDGDANMEICQLVADNGGAAWTGSWALAATSRRRPARASLTAPWSRPTAAWALSTRWWAWPRRTAPR